MMKNLNASAIHLNEQVQSDLDESSPDLSGLQIGSALQLQIGAIGYIVTLIGYLKGQGLMVTTPLEHENPTQPEEGQAVVVRFFNDRRAHAFNSTIQQVVNKPFPYLQLAYPEETHELRERQHDRIKINITGNADSLDGKSFSCVVQDISMGGALIAVNDLDGSVNDKLVLTLHVVVNDIEYNLSLDSEIRSVRIETSSGGSLPSVMQGLSFSNLSKEEILALAALELLPDWDSTA
jgi:c-di-GMP-binding flagellar brake protein YcgR